MKKDRYKTKEQLINEIQELRKRSTDLKGLDTQSQPAKEPSFILKEALRESEEQYRTLVEESFDGIFVQKGPKIIFSNHRLHTMLGYPYGELQGLDHWRVYHPDYQHITRERAQARMRGEQAIERYEVKLQRKDGTSFDGEIYAHATMLGNEPGIQVWVRDITDRKKAEEALRESEEKYRNVVERANDGITIIQDTIVKYLNSRMVEMWGGNVEEILGTPFTNYVHPDELSKVVDRHKRRMAGEDVTPIYETVLRRKDGSKVYAELNAGVITFQGKPADLVIIRDITERKQAEEALEQSEEKHRVLIETTDTGYLILDAQGRVIDANKEYIRLTGYGALEEILGRGVVEWTAPYDLERNAAEVKRCVEQGYVRNLEIDYINRSGQITPIELNATVLGSGYSARILSLCRDITDRRRTEQKLKESEKKYRNIFEHAVEGIFQSTPEGKFLSVNLAMAKMYGYTSPEEMVNSITDIGTQYYVDPKRRIEFRHLLDTQGIVEGFELEAYRKDGSKIWVSENVRAVQDEEGKLLYYEGTIEDITKQKQAVEALRTLEDLESSVLSAIPHAVIGLKERKIIFANNAVETVFGWKPEELIGKNTRVLYRTEEEYKEIGQHFYPVLEKQQTYSEDFPCRRKDGKDMLCRVSTSRIGESLKERQIVVMYEDITEQKQAQMLLHESEEKYRSIVEYAMEGIYQTTRGGQLIMGNKSFLQMLGYDSFEELTESIRDIGKQLYVEPGQREELMRILDKQNVVSGFETQLYRKDGSAIWVSFKVRTVRDSKGNLLYNEGTMEDITYRKQAEESIRQNIDRLRKAIGGTIDVIAMAVEVRDPYTSGHQRRVSSLGRSIAKKMDLSQEVTDGIRMAGVIHDLGKISIPAEILSMPRKLTELEFGLIKTHPQIGYDMLKDIEFPYPIARIVLQHHERLDGSGYPLGLKNEDIILEAKILAVADVVEAIASHRPYRPALGMDIALKEIIQNKGILYDPQVVEACVKLFENNGFKFE